MIKYLFGDNKIVPVVMFHSIGLHDATDWAFYYISEPIKIFEQKIKILYNFGYNFIFWKDLFLYMSGRKKITLPAVMLTFDDGYLDNWTNAYPILKKYGAKATIFVTPEFVDPSLNIRGMPQNDFVSGQATPSSCERGFLNWEEMRSMEKSGLVDIQSHAMTHTWYFSGPRVVDFYSSEDNRFPWLQWNREPKTKPYYMRLDNSPCIPLGLPVYEHQKALVCRQYYPSQDFGGYVTSFVNDCGADIFFDQRNWKKILFQKYTKYKNRYGVTGKYESNDDYERRIFNELFLSKKIIETELDKEVDFICWPGGAYNAKVLSIAKGIGYKSWTLGSSDQSLFRNRCEANPETVKRIGSYTKVKIGDKDLGFASGRDFICSVKRHQNAFLYKYLDYFRKVLKLAADKV